MIYTTIEPKSLIQIHYHNRIAGVTKVIDEYALSFQRISNSFTAKSYLICNDVQNKKEPSTVTEIISTPDCDYHKFRSKNAFTIKYKKLFQKINHIFTNPSIPRPLCIVGHNLSLGKNIALTMAFSLLALKYHKTEDMLFFSVIHDLAEEGRLTILHNLINMESLGIPVWNHLYPRINVHFIVLNKRNYSLFKHAGYSVSFLPNPLKISYNSIKLEKNKLISIQNALSAVSNIDRINFDITKKTYFYPVRVISRKNILEAIIIACLIYKGNLIVGGYGTSQKDRILYNKILHHVRKNNLSVLLNVERVKNYLSSDFFGNSSVFEYLYTFSHSCITTSLVEGFGYALYEPWMYGKKVVGRLPQGIGCSEIIDLTHLYKSLTIPLSWISLETIKNKYFFQLKSFFQGNTIFSHPEHFHNYFIKSFVHNNFFDFGALTQEMQFSVFNKVCFTQDISKINLIFKNKMYDSGTFLNLQKNMPDTSRVNKNRNIIKNLLGENAFDRAFKRCFFSCYSFTDTIANNNQSFAKYLLNPKNYKIIMAV